MDKLDFAIKYAFSFVGKPYKWGGEEPNAGFDCSGYVQEILRAVGVDKPGDQNSAALYRVFKEHSIECLETIPAGSLCFFGSSKRRISHVSYAIGNELILEAGGGGSLVENIDDAIAARAFVRMRPITFRRDLVAVVYNEDWYR